VFLGCRLLHGQPPLQPVTVCDVLENLQAYDGKVAAVVGRFSFRQTGRWLAQQKCDHQPATAGQQAPHALWLVYNPEEAPKPPAVLGVNAAALAQKLREVQRTTTLTQIPFGSPDYDHWAVVYGRVETRKNGSSLSPAQLVCHGEAVVVFLNEDATAPGSP
jgi:hypothetical protein